MCGINLCIGKDNIETMNQLLVHRGIRSTITALQGEDDGLHMGHIRLPIQGLDQSTDHPMVKGRWVGAFVGEVLNYKCFGPNAPSDLPVILNEWDERGSKCFEDFEGFWSVVIYDTVNDLLHVILDPLAKKPLYWRRGVGISSEIKTLSALGPINFDPLYFSAVAKWGYCPDYRTPFKEIKKLPADTHMRFTSDLQMVPPYYHFDTFNATRYLTDSDPDLRVTIKEAVEFRIVSDVPISLLMSGGLDSTLIYYILREYVDGLTIFHVDNNEAQYLKYVDFRPTDNLIKLDINEDNYNIEDILYMNDGPVDLGSMIPQYLLSREIHKQGFKVCISGDGADELFGGYKRAMEYDSQFSDIFHELIYYHLPRLDKMMMAHTVELRCPFLSTRVIKGALNLPWNPDRMGKTYLKDLAWRVGVPEQIINRKKVPLRYMVGKNKQTRRLDLIDKYKEMVKEDL